MEGSKPGLSVVPRGGVGSAGKPTRPGFRPPPAGGGGDWLVVAPRGAVIQRLKESRGLTEAESQARINSQLPTEEKIKKADLVPEFYFQAEKQIKTEG